MRVIVGLRNPGADYAGTRHNVGAEVVDVAAARSDRVWSRAPSRVRCEIASGRSGDEKVILAKPLGFMNDSGGPVRALLGYFKVEPGDLLVVHDDIDLPFGRLKIQEGGGTGGHNGLRSIEAALGTREFWRLKVGVGRPPGRLGAAEYVLRSFAKAERVEVDLMVEDGATALEVWVHDPNSARTSAARRS